MFQGLDKNGVLVMSSNVVALICILAAFVVLAVMGQAELAKDYVVPLLMVVIGAFGANSAHIAAKPKSSENEPNRDPAAAGSGKVNK